MPERKGQYTVMLSSRPTVLGYAAVVGKKGRRRPLWDVFSTPVFDDTTMGEKTWEKAESAFQKAFTRALNKAGFSPSQVNFLFAGDLLNQNIASTFGLRETNVPPARAVRRLLHYGADPGSGRYFCGQRRSRCVQRRHLVPFLYGRTPVPLPAGIWGTASADLAVDRHRRRFCRGGHGRERPAYRIGLHWAGHRSRRDRYEQYGGRPWPRPRPTRCTIISRIPRRNRTITT